MKTNYLLKSACALVMCAGSVLSFQAKADAVVIGGIAYNLDDATLTAETAQRPRNPSSPDDIVPYEGALVIPASVANGGKTYAVKRIGNNSLRNSPITSLTIAEGIEVIGNSAIAQDEELVTVVIPSTVKSIEDWAFYGCYKLASINIPDGVPAITEHTFQQCKALTSVTLPASVKSLKVCAFQDAEKLASINLENITEIIAWSLYGTAITSAHVKNVEALGNEAFRKCPNLETVTLEGVKATGDWTFTDCPKLTSVTLGEGLEDIGGGVFSGCSTLKTLTIPNTVFSIGGWALEKTALEEVYVSWANVDSDTGDVIINPDALGQGDGKPYFTWYVPEALIGAYPFNWFGLPVDVASPTGTKTVQATDATAWYANGTLHLSNLQGNSAAVYTIDGKTVARFQVTGNEAQVPVALPQGVYILKAGTTAIKFIAK